MRTGRDEIESAVRDVLARHGGLSVDAATLAADRDLFEGAGLTSLASVNVLVALEGEFDVELPDERFTREHVATIDAIVESLRPLIG